MIRCCHCTIWFHEKCVGLTGKDSHCVWSCPNCRDMAQNVKSMGTKIDSVLKAIKEISEENKAILTWQTSLEKVVNDLKDQNEILKNQNNQLLAEIELTKRNVTVSSIPGPSDAIGSLVIGSSLIKNFDEAKLPNHTVCCMPVPTWLTITLQLVFEQSPSWLVGTIVLSHLIDSISVIFLLLQSQL